MLNISTRKMYESPRGVPELQVHHNISWLHKKDQNTPWGVLRRTKGKCQNTTFVKWCTSPWPLTNAFSWPPAFLIIFNKTLYAQVIDRDSIIIMDFTLWHCVSKFHHFFKFANYTSSVITIIHTSYALTLLMLTIYTIWMYVVISRQTGRICGHDQKFSKFPLVSLLRRNPRNTMSQCDLLRINALPYTMWYISNPQNKSCFDVTLWSIT